MGTFLVGLVIIGITACVIRKMIRDKKNGKMCSCGGDCGKCGGNRH